MNSYNRLVFIRQLRLLSSKRCKAGFCIQDLFQWPGRGSARQDIPAAKWAIMVAKNL
ncbi:hypothetical protein FHS16_004011 [Paenibacillus endophyticus]|uniref:Uncharacterized protein n=1 Tax=Paenibacillus endophyticus TaxID=1294268 RepID=A0A7W5CA67_9BACL|nr:hypothetical protein [Paenibacillus endophyticus]